MRTLITFALLVSACGGQVADKKFLFVVGGNAVATGLDAYTTQTCSYESWNPTLYGQKPRALRVGIVMGGLFVASTVVSYELKKHHAHLWRIPLWALPSAYEANGHFQGAIHNLRICG